MIKDDVLDPSGSQSTEIPIMPKMHMISFNATATITLFTLAPWPWPNEVLFTLGELYPRQSGQHRRDCLGEDLGEGQV